MKFDTLTAIGCFTLLLSGCVSYKQVPYLQELEAFEINMKIIMNGYSDKIEQREKFKDENSMMKLAEQLQDDYKEFTSNCRDYIDSLRIKE